ncbi:MAG: hypothetical protein PVI03_01580 [Candidatus Thorarchaeota archaeon]|jgi:hypothetical protein
MDIRHIHDAIIDNPDFNLTVAAKRDLRELCAENERLLPLAKSAELELVEEYTKGKRDGMERAAEILQEKRCYSGAKIIRAEIKGD